MHRLAATVLAGLLLAGCTTPPSPTPQAEWRPLASGLLRGGEAYVVRVATESAEYQVMWSALDRVNPAPGIDLQNEIAVSFAHGIGSSCQDLRLDDVVIDHDARLIYSATSFAGGQRACTADLIGAVYFVVAIDRSGLPASPFTVRLTRTPVCAGCDREEVTVDLSE